MASKTPQLPVSDVDQAKAFYEQVGLRNLHDTQVTDTMRVVQLTPSGSSCAIVFGTGMGPITGMAPGSEVSGAFPLSSGQTTRGISELEIVAGRRWRIQDGRQPLAVCSALTPSSRAPQTLLVMVAREGTRGRISTS